MSENSNLKSRFTIDLCKSVEGVDSVVSSNKSDRKNEIRPPKRELKTVQKFDEVTVTVEKIDETGTTLPFESYDPKDIKIEIDSIDNDITDNTDDVIEQSMNIDNENDDLKSEIDVVKDNTSNSDGKVDKSDDTKVPFVDVEIADDSSEALESNEIFEKVDEDKPKVKVITPKNKK